MQDLTAKSYSLYLKNPAKHKTEPQDLAKGV